MSQPRQRRSLELPGLPRCLIVEDEPDVARVFSFHLYKHGFTVTTAGTLQSAHQQLLDPPWRLVFVDIVLPDGDGRDLVAHLRTLPRPPMVVLTSVLTPYDVPTHDADSFLTKPFRQGDLIRVLHEVGVAAST